MENTLKKLVLLFLLISSSLFGELLNQYPSLKLLSDNTPIVDIRTPGEWKETGLIKGAIPIMFWDERGTVDVNGFLKELNQKVDTTKTFAIICRTGNRTKVLAGFLSNKLHYKVINVTGGMMMVKAKNLPIVPYK